MKRENLARLDAMIGRIMTAARIPGVAIAVVVESDAVLARGYGYRDLHARLPMTADTIFPIGSTTKAMNAAVLGMLVDEGLIGWDVPLQEYLPRFRLSDPVVSMQVMLRDLLTMRTGLPRHDWTWLENTITRAELVDRLGHLELSCGFRQRFQYNNLTIAAAGHIAETMTGRSWDALVRENLLEPLAMSSTTFGPPMDDSGTVSYHETADRELIPSRSLLSEAMAPGGATLHSNVKDMARWLAFNLNGGVLQGRRLLQPNTIREIHSPQVVAGKDASAPSPNATYTFGWFHDTYNGCRRLSHGGYLSDVNSAVAIFPEHRVAIVTTTNFGCPRLARLINQHAFDTLMDLEPAETLEERLAAYEKTIEETRANNAAAVRVVGTSPSHPLQEYVGTYAHAAYGQVEIQLSGDHELFMRRGSLAVRLQHWHYDAWVVIDDRAFAINEPHPFDAVHRLLFETDADGAIVALSLRLEPAVARVRLTRIFDLTEACRKVIR